MTDESADLSVDAAQVVCAVAAVQTEGAKCQAVVCSSTTQVRACRVRVRVRDEWRSSRCIVSVVRRDEAAARDVTQRFDSNRSAGRQIDRHKRRCVTA